MNDDEEQHRPESEWISAVLVLTLPLAIALVAFGCSYFV